MNKTLYILFTIAVVTTVASIIYLVLHEKRKKEKPPKKEDGPQTHKYIGAVNAAQPSEPASAEQIAGKFAQLIQMARGKPQKEKI